MIDVKYIGHLGSDMTVVDAARVSYDRRHDQYTEEQNTRLIKYLAGHDHWTPFGHCSMTVLVNAPIFVARQLVKHQVGLVWNEVSRRYVDDRPTFYKPDHWRTRPENSKQGSGPNVNVYTATECEFEFENLVDNAVESYDALLKFGVAPEQARMVLPLCTMTQWYWSGSMVAFHRVYTQRISSDSQYETSLVAKRIDEIASNLWPVSWEALNASV